MASLCALRKPSQPPPCPLNPPPNLFSTAVCAAHILPCPVSPPPPCVITTNLAYINSLTGITLVIYRRDNTRKIARWKCRRQNKIRWDYVLPNINVLTATLRQVVRYNFFHQSIVKFNLTNYIVQIISCLLGIFKLVHKRHIIHIWYIRIYSDKHHHWPCLYPTHYIEGLPSLLRCTHPPPWCTNLNHWLLHYLLLAMQLTVYGKTTKPGLLLYHWVRSRPTMCAQIQRTTKYCISIKGRQRERARISAYPQATMRVRELICCMVQ